MGEDKISLYAEDGLLFLGDTSNSLNSVISLINHFSTFSGFKINWDKSCIMIMDSLEVLLPGG